MKIGIISFTGQGLEIAKRISEILTEYETVVVQKPEEGIHEWVKKQFDTHSALVFVGACGIAVRLIAPLLKDKLSDPPVLVVDELGKFVIPILSGHMGGANELALKLADKLGATSVITTATDLQGKFAVDLFAKKNGLIIMNKEGIAFVSSKILRGEKITVAVAEGIEVPYPPEFIEIAAYPPKKKVDILITFDRKERGDAFLYLKPRRIIVGIGCKKGKPEEELEDFIRKHLTEMELTFFDVAAISSIERKKEEEGIVTLAEKNRIPFVVFSEEELRAVNGCFSGSQFVEQTVGVDNVCERAAIAACGENGTLILSKQAGNGMTIAAAEKKVQIIWE